jgi:phthalate 4,5-dioxygenase oxygenase subunit
MLTHEENMLMCRVEGDAPMGQLMRRHWQVVCLAEEVPEPDGTPVRARVFGENLVVFRDTNGLVGVLDEQCPHRGASLVYGRNERGGLRCLYHGWKMDVCGRIIEMSSAPAERTTKLTKLKHKAYPTHEWAGAVWAYMGPPDTMTAFMPPPWAPTDDVQVSIAKIIIPANWAQILEGQIDSAHSSSLHSSDILDPEVVGAPAVSHTPYRFDNDKVPRIQIEVSSYGFRYAALRQTIQNATTHQYVRTTVFVAPSTALIPPNDQYNMANFNTPIDDHHTAFHFIAWGDPQVTPDTAAWRKFLRTEVGVDVDATFRPVRHLGNHFMQNRAAMKASNFTGISGIPNQDLAMWAGMGAIRARENDHLAPSDTAIMAFRRQMLDAVKSFVNGGRAIGTGDLRAPTEVCSFQGMLPKIINWRDLNCSRIVSDKQYPIKR